MLLVRRTSCTAQNNMKSLCLLVLVTACLVTAGCKIIVTVPEGGSVTTESGAYSCQAGSECVIDVVDVMFNETFTAVPDEGYEFVGWKKRPGAFCGNRTDACHLTTERFDQFEEMLALLASDAEYFLEPEFAAPEEQRVGFEILQVISPNEIRAWVGPSVTREEFDALELPEGWFKNQPREGGALVNGPTSSQFLRSPDATEDGDILIEEHFGLQWFHAATIFETNVELDSEGLLRGSLVRKYHELTFAAGSTIPLLVSPENEAYFLMGRDADRVSDEPTIPNLWQLVEYVTEEDVVFELFEQNLVIRTDNQDSFQGPVAIGEYTIQEEENVLGEAGPLELSDDLCEDPANMDVLTSSPIWPLLTSSSELNPEQVERMVAEPTRGPFYMLNLIRFRELAQYSDGRETDLTGREANSLYSPIEYLSAIGAAPVFVAQVGDQVDGDDTTWHDVAIVEYPCPVAFFAMITTPGFQARAIHKDAGVEKTIVMVTHLQTSQVPEDSEWPQTPYPATEEDPAFELIHVMDFHDLAQYEEGTDEPERTGEEAWREYQAAGSSGGLEIGSHPTATLDIQGVIIGDDGRNWDEASIVYMPSMAGYEALLGNTERQEASYHRLAALANNYSLVTYPFINNLPDDADSGGGTGGGLLPVTETGVGTICSSDADCVGIGFCLKGDSETGFCSMECGSGECGDSYQCCHSCSELVQSRLPFSSSACMVNDDSIIGQLTAAPVSCTCD